MTTLISDYDLLIADSSTLFRFFEAGPDCTRKLMEHCTQRLYIVGDVAEEIARYASHATMAAGIAVFNELIQHDPIDLPPQVALAVSDLMKMNRRLFGLTDKDEGETATVFYAAWARDQENRQFLILMRDNDGRRLAEDRNLALMETQELVVDLVCGSVLTVEDGALVFQSIYGASYDRSRYVAMVKRSCPERFS